MMSDQIREVEEAARFITRVLADFSGREVYKIYREVENFTDEEFENALETLSDFGNGTAVLERMRPL
ncbi:hypothetical protein LCGC14_0294650 [marine sediment metagenome]|uniref:Uncharacterized protein n=1 Tax=marine sediment metagenome TaxID=412755 RepID=A0A0F9U926_9ZZZZ